MKKPTGRPEEENKQNQNCRRKGEGRQTQAARKPQWKQPISRRRSMEGLWSSLRSRRQAYLIEERVGNSSKEEKWSGNSIFSVLKTCLTGRKCNAFKVAFWGAGEKSRKNLSQKFVLHWVSRGRYGSTQADNWRCQRSLKRLLNLTHSAVLGELHLLHYSCEPS